MKKVATTILLIPFALLGGLPYGLVADKIFREREPWFTITMLCGLGVTVCAMTWLGGASRTTAIWVFVGTGICYVALRLLFGSGSALEMFYVAHVLAIMLLLFLPALARAKEKARRLHEMRPNQSAAANRRPALRPDGSSNLATIVAADRAFPAAVAELGR